MNEITCSLLVIGVDSLPTGQAACWPRSAVVVPAAPANAFKTSLTCAVVVAELSPLSSPDAVVPTLSSFLPSWLRWYCATKRLLASGIAADAATVTDCV